jgi:hypothetical protein
MGRACNTNGGKMNAYIISVGKSERKRPLGRSSRGLEDNIKMGLRQIYWGGIDWNNPGSRQGQVEGSCEHGNEPSGSVKY